MLIKFFFIRVFNFVVAKRTSVFDDPTMEIQELTSVIKQDITALNSAVVDLQLISNSRNESGNVSTDTTSHSTTVVDDLKTRLMSTTKEFKDVLTMRTEVLVFVICICVIVHFFFTVIDDNYVLILLFICLYMKNLKVHENRRQLFSANASKDNANPFIRQRPLATKSAASASNAPAPPWASG
jgi:syntaxin 5